MSGVSTVVGSLSSMVQPVGAASTLLRCCIRVAEVEVVGALQGIARRPFSGDSALTSVLLAVYRFP